MTSENTSAKRVVSFEIGNPMPTLVFTFTLIVVMIWGATTGIAGPDALLFLGLFQFGCVPVYLASSMALIKSGESLLGNIFLMFTTAFGMISGLGNFAAGLAPHFGVTLDNALYNFPLLWSGILLVAVLIACRKADICTLIAFAGGAWTLTTGALMGLGVIPPVLGPINGWVSLAVAVFGGWTVFADICAMGGVNVPKGPSIIK